MTAPALRAERVRERVEQERLAAALPAETPSRPFPTVHIMQGDPPPSPFMHVDRLLLAEDINLLTGHGGKGKSPVLLSIAVCTVVGRAVFGTLPIHRQGPVLLILPEDGQAAARMMLDAIVAGLSLTEDERRLLTEGLVMVSDDVLVNITTDVRRIRDTALAHGACLVGLDPVRNLLGGEAENDNDIAGSVCDTLRREVCRAAGATVLATLHFRKPAKDAPADAAPSRHDVRGGGAWVDGSRLAFGVSKSGNRITLAALKANRIAGEVRHEVDLTIVADPDNEAHWLSCRLTDANAGAASNALTPGVGRSINANERAALSALDNRHEPGRRVSWSEWTKTAGINPDTLKSIKQRLLESGLADALPAGMHRNGGNLYNYAITDRGRTALDTGWTIDPQRVRG